MAMTFTEIPADVAKASLARKQRVSKHRETLQSFWDADIPAAQLDLEPGEDGEAPNKGSVASGLLNALKAAKEQGTEWADKITVRNRADGVFLINRVLLPEDENAPEHEGAEEADAA